MIRLQYYTITQLKQQAHSSAIQLVWLIKLAELESEQVSSEWMRGGAPNLARKINIVLFTDSLKITLPSLDQVLSGLITLVYTRANALSQLIHSVGVIGPLMTLGRCVLLYFWMQEVTRDLYMSRHKIYSVKISHSSKFNPTSITLWYENNIIIFFLSIVMDSGKRVKMNETIAVFSDSVLGNTANYAAGFSSAKYIWLAVIEFQLFCPWVWINFFVYGYG